MASDLKGEELTAIVTEIRDRVRARHPNGQVQGIGVPLPDLLPILHARDAAEGKVAAIGSVNPRAGGPVNALIQVVKRSVARGLNWFVRDQVEYNRAILTAIEATLESLNEANRTFAAIGARMDDLERGLRLDIRAATDQANALADEARELKDIRAHWVHWRDEWEKKLFQNEVHYLRGLSDLQGSMDARSAKMDANYRETILQQHGEFARHVETTVENVHKRFWAELDKIRAEYEKLIHNELRVVRQKAFASAASAGEVLSGDGGSAASPVNLEIDYSRFADRFRGSEEYVRAHQRFYLPYFEGKKNVLDIGCGRGEFLELMRDAGVPARGVDLDEESVALCRSKGLSAETADVFRLLAAEADGAFDGIFASQVIEHMTPEQVPHLVKLCSAKLKPGGVLALETPNPECLAIFATHFYLDPTHQRPIPPNLLVFYYEEFGLGRIEVHRLSPAAESMPSVKELPAGFREAFFGGLDYCAIGRKL